MRRRHELHFSLPMRRVNDVEAFRPRGLALSEADAHRFTAEAVGDAVLPKRDVKADLTDVVHRRVRPPHRRAGRYATQQTNDRGRPVPRGPLRGRVDREQGGLDSSIAF